MVSSEAAEIQNDGDLSGFSSDDDEWEKGSVDSESSYSIDEFGNEGSEALLDYTSGNEYGNESSEEENMDKRSRQSSKVVSKAFDLTRFGMEFHWIKVHSFS